MKNSKTKPKVVLITGCSSGIGYRAALKFARNGFKTYASVRNSKSEGAQELTKVAGAENLPLQVLELDVTKDTTITKAIQKIKLQDKKLDILINNAGFGYLGPVEQFSVEEVQDQFDTNLLGVIRMVKAVAPIMRQQGQGTIINISSIAGCVVFPLFGVYSASKYSLEALSEALRFDLGHFGIKVALVEPGSFATKFSDNRKYPSLFSNTKSPYQPLIKGFFNRYAKTHAKSKRSLTSKVLDPTQIVELIFKVANTANPKMRYMLGNDAFMFSTLKKLLPYWAWEFLLKKTYKW